MARSAKITYEGGSIWSVTDADHVCLVNLDRRASNCTEFLKSRPRVECSHHWAVLYTIEPPTLDEFQTRPLDPATDVADVQTSALADFFPTQGDAHDVLSEVIRGGYTSHAGAYDEALRAEFPEMVFFARRLFDQIGGAIMWREPNARGRRHLPLANILLSNFMRSYHDWSYRRTEGLMRFLAHERVHLIGQDYPDFNLASQFNRSENATPLLRDILALTGEPFREIGSLRFAADGTGMGSSHFSDYRCEKRDGKEEARSARWYRAHVIGDVDSLHAVCVRVTGPQGSEKTVMLEMIEDLAARGYTGSIDEIIADGGYHSAKIRDAIAEIKAKPVIPWHENTKNAISRRYLPHTRHPAIIKAMFHIFSREPQRFKNEYRMRVKIENLFSAVKGRFGGYVRSLDPVGAENEILWKFICHNVHVLLMAARVYGIEHELLKGDDDAA